MICIITDAWEPQVNGVVTTLTNLKQQLEADGHEVTIVESTMFKNVSTPGYKEIKLAYDYRAFEKYMFEINPEYIHIATEGPLGLFGRRFCVKNNFNFTTSFHTKFPEFIKSRISFFPLSLGYAYLRWFHSKSSRVLVTTNCIKDELHERGFTNMVTWTRGVDKSIFQPMERTDTEFNILYVGRVSHEKNIEAFCELALGKMIVVGDGPARKYLEKKFKHVEFVGVKRGKELAQYYSNADCFVFPSKADTFGVVLLESISCGTPIATYPVSGPKSVVEEGINGYTDDDLYSAVLNSIALDREPVYNSSEKYTWENCKKIFLDNLIPTI